MKEKREKKRGRERYIFRVWVLLSYPKHDTLFLKEGIFYACVFYVTFERARGGHTATSAKKEEEEDSLSPFFVLAADVRDDDFDDDVFDDDVFEQREKPTVIVTSSSSNGKTERDGAKIRHFPGTGEL